MSKLIPERPLYRRERLIVGYLMLAVLTLLFLCRLAGNLLDIPFGTLLGAFGIGILALALPALIFVLVRGRGYTAVLRLRLPHATHVPLLLSAFFALLTGSMLLSILCGGLDTLGNTVASFGSRVYESAGEALLAVLVLAIVPAVLEEFLFRGIVLAEYERRGAVRAVLLSALLFALAHLDPHNLPAHVFAGVLLALAVFATDSLPAAMLLHVLYRLTALFTQSYLNALYRMTGSVTLLLFLLVVVFLVALLLTAHFAARIYRRRDEQKLRSPRRDVPWNVQFYTILDALSNPPLLLALVPAIVGMIIL